MLKDTLTSLYFPLLEEMMSIEDQLIAHLPNMIEAANSESLKTALSDHLAETRNQKTRLQEIFDEHNHDPAGGQAEAFTKMIQQTETMVGTIADDVVRDAYIIASAQAVEHIEIAKYGTLIAWAEVLEDDFTENNLKTTLGEEEHADKLLSKLGEGSFLHSSINKEAVTAGDYRA